MKAKRPRFSALESIKLPKYGIQTQRWEEALKEYLIEKGYLS
jgi:dTDP-4-dehydrorhamnose reductase